MTKVVDDLPKSNTALRLSISSSNHSSSGRLRRNSSHILQRRSSSDQSLLTNDELSYIEESEEDEMRKLKEKEEREAHEKMQRRQRERKQVEMEILSTERDYVRNLDMCSAHFIKPIKDSLQSGKPILNQDDYETMFVDLETIIPVNREMLNSLENFAKREKEIEEMRQRGEQVVIDPKAETLGTIFLRMTPYLKSYTAFCNKYETIFKLIEDRKLTRKVFRKFLESKEYQPEVNFQALIGFLIRPVQRIPRYNLLLRELIKNTEEDHPDLNNLTKANTSVVNLANYVNEKLREAMNQEKCIHIENIVGGLNFELIQASRKFIKEGALGYISSKNGIQSRYVFLFSDMLLSTKSKTTIIDYKTNDSTGTNAPNFNNPEAAMTASAAHDQIEVSGGDDDQKKREKGRKNREKFTLRSAISFQSVPLVWLNNLPDGFIRLNAFQIVTSRKTYTFFASDAEAKKEWVTAISKHLDIQHASPLLQGKESSEICISETSKYHVFAGTKTVEDLHTMGDSSFDTILGSLKCERHEMSPTINRLKFGIARRSSNPERLEGTSPKSPRHRRSFSTFIKTFTKRKDKNKKVLSDAETVVVSDSEDEEEEATKDMLPWMTDYYERLLEKQTHTKFIKKLNNVAEEFKPVLEDLQQVEGMDNIVLNPLYGVKVKTTRSYRVSVCEELKGEIDLLESKLSPASASSSVTQQHNSLPSTRNQRNSLPLEDNFDEFVKAYTNKANINAAAMESISDTGAPKEKRRRSLFASLTQRK